MWKRGSRKLIQNHNTKDIYKHYSSKCKKSGKIPIPYNKYWEVFNEFMDLRMQLVIFDNLEFYLPARMGSIRVEHICSVISVNKNNEVIMRKNYGATNKLWKQMYPDKTNEEILNIPDRPYVYYTNPESDSKLFKIMWDKITCNFVNNSVYSFLPIRKWNRLLKRHIVENGYTAYPKSNKLILKKHNYV